MLLKLLSECYPELSISGKMIVVNLVIQDEIIHIMVYIFQWQGLDFLFLIEVTLNNILVIC